MPMVKVSAKVPDLDWSKHGTPGYRDGQVVRSTIQRSRILTASKIKTPMDMYVITPRHLGGKHLEPPALARNVNSPLLR